MVKKVTFSINEEGEVEVNAEGFAGADCEKFTEPFEKALGMVDKREHKDSYFAQESEYEQVEGQV